MPTLNLDYFWGSAHKQYTQFTGGGGGGGGGGVLFPTR